MAFMPNRGQMFDIVIMKRNNIDLMMVSIEASNQQTVTLVAVIFQAIYIQYLILIKMDKAHTQKPELDIIDQSEESQHHQVSSYHDPSKLRSKSPQSLSHSLCAQQQELPTISYHPSISTKSITNSQQTLLLNRKIGQKAPLQARKQQFISKQNIKGRISCDMSFYFKNQIYNKIRSDFLNKFSIIAQDDENRLKFQEIFRMMKEKGEYKPAVLELSTIQSRSIAAIMGMAVADALGASTEFEHFNKKGLGAIKKGFRDIKKGRHGKIGIWTDDAAMGLCIADSVLLNDYVFNPTHIRYLFTLWLRHGLNNGGRPHSIGLGGNISISMQEFMHKQQPYTAQGDQFNNGNGSLMRLAPLPVAFRESPQQAVEYCGMHSLTTHNGKEASECCRLLGQIIVALINRGEEADGKSVLLQVCNSFKTKQASVECLARGMCESQQLYREECEAHRKFKAFNKSIKDRNWNWRDEEHTYSPTRLKQQPGYIGSYCMDALSMALHTVWFSKNWKEVAIRNADMGGDCDTVGSIAGQIAGALYGLDQGMLELYSQMQDFASGSYEVFLKAYMLASKQKLPS